MPNTLAENLQRLKTTKTEIANAITAKGGTVGANDGLEDFASDIGTIPTGGGISAPRRIPILNQKYKSNWSTMTWGGLTSFLPSRIWTDGTDIYYSNISEHYRLDEITHTWSTMTWRGVTNFDGNHVWTDGTDIYYSYDSQRYILNKSTHTWSTMTWTGLTNFYGAYVWTDGTDIYYSSPSSTKHYVLDKDNRLFTVKPYIE